MSASTTLRRRKRIVVAAAGLGLAAATLAPAASAAPVQAKATSSHSAYVQPTCHKGTYNCNPPGPSKIIKIVKKLKAEGAFTKAIKKLPPKEAAKVVKVYRSIAWLFR